MGWEGGAEAGTGHHISSVGARSQTHSWRGPAPFPSPSMPWLRYHEEEGTDHRRGSLPEPGAAVWRKAVNTRGSEVVLPALSLLSTFSRN